MIFGKFVITGILANIINFIFYFLFFNFGATVNLSSIIGYISGLTVSFYFSKTWVFEEQKNSTLRMYSNFFLIYALGGLGMTILIDYFTNHYFLDFKISWIFGTLFAAINNFLGLKFIVFKNKEFK
jgi:putative flippase GtrA